MKKLPLLFISIGLCLLGCGEEETPVSTVVRDTVPPAIIGANIQAGPIPVNTPIVLVFSERVHLTSAQRGISVRSSIDATPIRGVITLQKDGREVKFIPTDQMTAGAYVLTALGIEDMVGNVSLTPVAIFFSAVEIDTAQPAVDVTPPRVVSSIPAEGKSVKPTDSLIVRFDEEVDADSAQLGIVVSGSEGTVEVAGAVAIFRPDEPMKVGEHTLVIVGIKDLSGNILASSHIIPFRVIAPPQQEPTPPTIIARPSTGGGKVIYLDVADFIPGESQFGVEVDGNKWIEVADRDALGGTAFGGPGDNDRDNANPPGVPFLVIRFPERVRAGESTAAGKTWIPWARMRVPTDRNSFFWQVSRDKKNWKPKDNTNTNRWNDDARNGSDQWYWQDNLTGNDGAINADLAVGDNYLQIGVRESDPVNFPRIDVVCFRNDGKKPSDVEAAEALSILRPVEPAGKLAATWGELKQGF